MIERDTPDTGIIVGRFQTPILHEGHIEIIQHALNLHKKVIIILGVAPVKDRKNLLDYQSREQMIKSRFPEVIITLIKNRKYDKDWVKDLDEIINALDPFSSKVIYGSRDSFINCYVKNNGKYNTIELSSPKSFINATQIRNDYSKTYSINSVDYRVGIITDGYNRFPACIPTVDVAIVDYENDKLLLGRKQDETKYRFVGGFAEPNSESFEKDALREAYEETGLEVGDIKYIASALINDWRFPNENKIKTILFIATYIYGSPSPDDDIFELKWFDIYNLSDDDFEPEHIILYNLFKEYYVK